MSVRVPPAQEKPPSDDGALLSLRALIILLLSTGSGVLIYVITQDLVGAITVAVALLVALSKLVR